MGMEQTRYYKSTLFLIFLFFILSIFIPKFSIFDGLIEFPKNYKLPIASYISSFIKWLLEDANFVLFSFKDLTRAFGAIFDAPSNFLKGLLATGFKYESVNGESTFIQPLPWVSVILIFVMIFFF